MKKTLSILIVSVFVLSLTAVLFGCTPAKIENVVGTYRLTVDTITYYQQDTVDNLEYYQREAYLVITGEEIGYYVYKDKDTAVSVREIKLEYFKNDENKVTSVGYTLAVGDRAYSYNVDAKSDTCLISRWNSATKLIPAYDVTYKKIGKDSDLTAIKKIYGDLPVYKYGLYKFNGLYSAEIESSIQKNFGDYIYKFIEIDSANCKANVYYALRSDGKKTKLDNLDVSFVYSQDNGKPVKMIIGEFEYDLTKESPERPVKAIVSGVEVDTTEFLYETTIEDDYATYDDYFDKLIADFSAELEE